MSLLALNSVELQQKIERELAENPALEYLEERHCPNCHRRLPPNINCPKCSYGLNNGTSGSEEPIVFVAPAQEFAPGTGAGTYAEDEILDNAYAPDTEDLPTFVLQQIATELALEDRQIAAHILSSLDKDGLLASPLFEIARYHHVSIERVGQVIQLIQKAEPIGVGSPDSKSALLAQLDALGPSVPNPELIRQAIDEGLDLLTRRQFSGLAKLLGVSATKVQWIADFIGKNLNPYPARSHWGNQRHYTGNDANTYHKPDVIIRPLNTSENPQLVIEIMWPLYGLLRVNPQFRKALPNAPDDLAEKWRGDIERANLLIKCLSQRNHTIVRMMQLLAVIQRDFILKGASNIQPITRARIAEELGVHESTISRAVSGKTVQLPSKKIVPIAQFFDRSLHIRSALKKIVNQENKPLSDTKIAKLLAEKGHKVARRTVAKYRAMERIPPAHLRQV
jgi:RNA polymerase sigma-54 factor